MNKLTFNEYNAIGASKKVLSEFTTKFFGRDLVENLEFWQMDSEKVQEKWNEMAKYFNKLPGFTGLSILTTLKKIKELEDNEKRKDMPSLEDYPQDVQIKMKELCNKLLNGEIGRIGTSTTLEESEVAILLAIKVLDKINNLPESPEDKAYFLEKNICFFLDPTHGGHNCFYDVAEPIDHRLMSKLLGKVIESSKQIAELGGFGYKTTRVLNVLCDGNNANMPSYKETIFAQQDETGYHDVRQFTEKDKKILNENLILEAIDYALKHSPYA